MAIKTGAWEKINPQEWVYVTSAAARLLIKISDRGNASISTEGTWCVTKACLDELVDALTHVREEVYGKQNLP